MTATPTAADYKSDVRPVWCPGCGDYGVLAALTKALAVLELAPEKTCLVSGIGCSSRLPAYTTLYGFHGVHGRGLALASGLKLARPDLTVIAAGGDGDGFSIGGNHFLHACRRNADLTYVVMDNQVYGMTKGQASPTTPSDWCESKLTPHGTGVSPVEPLHLALAAGASFIARGFAGDPNGLTQLLADGIRHPGFSVIQVLSPCVTYRPEQRQWKAQTHRDDRPATVTMAEAMQRLAEDDGYTTGVLFAGHRPVFHPSAAPGATLAEIEEGFCP